MTLLETINKEITSVGEYLIMLAHASGQFVDYGFTIGDKEFVLMVREKPQPQESAPEETETTEKSE